MGIVLSKVRIENYKSIRNMLINLNETNVFFGKNNTGKTNILKSIYLGMNTETITSDDVFSSIDEPYMNSKKVIIDLYFKPINKAGLICSEFDDEWSFVLGDLVSIDLDSNQYFAFRTELSYDESKSLFVNIKKRIKVWNDDGTSTVDTRFNYKIFDFIQCYYVDANRDISADLKDRKSFWSKLVAKVKIAEDKKAEIQKQLSEINSSIKKESELLRNIEIELKKTVSEEMYDIDISPVTKDIESLYKGMEIYYSSQHFNSIPVANLGSGVRSWAVFSSIKSQIDLAISIINPFYSLLLIEEPEAHIHIQSQMKVANIIKDTKSQKIIATHSSHIISIFSIKDLYRIDKDRNGTLLHTFTDLVTDKSKIEKIFVTNKNDFLFAKLVVFVEGYTELMVMPLYFKRYFNRMPFDLGVTFISYDGGGAGSKPFLELANAFKLNWIVFSDGETSILNGLRNAIRSVFNNPILEISDERRIIFLPNKYNYESYLYNNGFKYHIHKVIDRFENEHKYILNEFIIGQKWTRKKVGMFFSSTEEEVDQATLLYLKDEKISVAINIADEILRSYKNKNDLPTMILNLMKKIEKEIKE